MDWHGMRVSWYRSVCQPPGCWFEIVCGIVNEQKDQAIAHELGISYDTLRTQLSRLQRKLGVQIRVGVAVRAFEAFIEVRQMEVDGGDQQSETERA